MPRSDDGAVRVTTHGTTPRGAPAVRSPARRAIARRTAPAAPHSRLRGAALHRGRLAQPRHPGEQLSRSECGSSADDRVFGSGLYHPLFHGFGRCAGADCVPGWLPSGCVLPRACTLAHALNFSSLGRVFLSLARPARRLLSMMSSSPHTGNCSIRTPRRHASSKLSMPSGANTRSTSNGPLLNCTKSFPRAISPAVAPSMVKPSSVSASMSAHIAQSFRAGDLRQPLGEPVRGLEIELPIAIFMLMGLLFYNIASSKTLLEACTSKFSKI